MWDLSRPGLEPVSPTLAGGFLTTRPPGKPPGIFSVGFTGPLFWCATYILDSALHVRLTTALWDWYCDYPTCFTDKEARAHGGDVTCSKSLVQKSQSWNLNSGILSQSPCFKTQWSSIQPFDFEGSDFVLDLRGSCWCLEGSWGVISWGSYRAAADSYSNPFAFHRGKKFSQSQVRALVSPKRSWGCEWQMAAHSHTWTNSVFCRWRIV